MSARHRSTALGVGTFALAFRLAGAEPEELATAVAASLRKVKARSQTPDRVIEASL